jgi:GH15 family glucan-1,4-alpha-glucosidase
MPHGAGQGEAAIIPLDYEPIANHGLIGDLHATALVSLRGNIDWLCLPRLDSPSVFASILDAERGGFFLIAPAEAGANSQQLYRPDTNVLVTRFLHHGSVAELTDLMPMPHDERAGPLVVRRVQMVRGSMKLRAECRPAFNYARGTHQVQVNGSGALFHSNDGGLKLSASVPLHSQEPGVCAEFVLQEGEAASFVLGWMGAGGEASVSTFSLDEIARLIENTIGYWETWLQKCTYEGGWREMVRRSALVLELLTYEPTGAIVAAPTCSLPESIGGERNWDYRFNWIRDAAFTIYSLLRVGLTDEATRFLGWLEDRCSEIAGDGPLQTVYGIDGRRDLQEVGLKELDGYKGSRPVRIGNAAHEQLQLDIYGPLVDALYLYNKHVAPISSELWAQVRRLLNWVCDNWQLPDASIWEVRGDPQQFVHSKLMCWVALDRGLRLAEQRSFPADRNWWSRTRDEIYEEILAKGWNSERRSFVQRYGSDALDASSLLMPLVFYMSPIDPKMVATVEAIKAPLSQGGLQVDGMVHRYKVESTPDGLHGEEGTFNMCTFWLVEALTRLGHVDEARWIFEKMLRRANHLGLYAEETGSGDEQLGNFPQAFTHMALITAAYNLDSAMRGKDLPEF